MVKIQVNLVGRVVFLYSCADRQDVLVNRFGKPARSLTLVTGYNHDMFIVSEWSPFSDAWVVIKCTKPYSFRMV